MKGFTNVYIFRYHKDDLELNIKAVEWQQKNFNKIQSTLRLVSNFLMSHNELLQQLRYQQL